MIWKFALFTKNLRYQMVQAGHRGHWVGTENTERKRVNRLCALSVLCETLRVLCVPEQILNRKLDSGILRKASNDKQTLWFFGLSLSHLCPFAVYQASCKNSVSIAQAWAALYRGILMEWSEIRLDDLVVQTLMVSLIVVMGNEFSHCLPRRQFEVD